MRRLFIIGILVVNTAISKPIYISGKVANYQNYKKLFLYEYFGNDLLKVDSIKIGSGSFNHSTNLPRGMYRIGLSETLSADVLLEDQNLTIEMDLSSPSNSLVVRNSKENDSFRKFVNSNINFNQFIQSLEKKAEEIQPLRMSSPDQYNRELFKFQSKADSGLKALNKEYLTISQLVPNSFLSKYLKSLVINDTSTSQNLITKNDLEDNELYRSNLLPIKLNILFQRYTRPEVQEYVNSAEVVLSKSNKPSNGKLVVYKTIIQMFNEANIDYTGTLVRKLSEEFPNDARAKRFIESIPKREYEVGDQAPEISLPDTTGNSFQLSSLKGKVVLLDFWASWCGPCRMENPNVVMAYNRFKDKGFTVFSVSLDNSKEKWKTAIKKDNMTWYHASDLLGWQSVAAKKYGVKGIPQTYLLDQNGKIIAKNLRGEELHTTLEKLFMAK